MQSRIRRNRYRARDQTVSPLLRRGNARCGERARHHRRKLRSCLVSHRLTLKAEIGDGRLRRPLAVGGKHLVVARAPDPRTRPREELQYT